MRFDRNAKGYGGVGITWSLGPLGNTIIIGLGKWRLSHHWISRAQRKELDHFRKAANDIAKKAQGLSENEPS